MSRGLGRQQRTVLAALRRLERERGPGWRSPAEVVAIVGEMTKPVRAPAVEVDPYERLERAQLAHCRELVAMGHRELAASVTILEERLAERVAARKARRAAPKAPNQIRATPRAGEGGNPSRVLALLEGRGLVVRRARRGPGSMVRLARTGAGQEMTGAGR